MSYDARLPFHRRHLPADVGPALRTARERRGSSRREIAEAAGIRPRTLARIERGQQKPLWPTLDRLCGELGIDVHALARRWGADSFDVPTDYDMVPGLGLRVLRRRSGMTLVRLAEASGVSASTLWVMPDVVA